MSRAKTTKAVQSAPAAKPSGRFYTVAKDSHLLYSAYQVDIVDGVVTAVKCLSRAPDLLASAVGYAQSELWAASREQTSEDMDNA